MKTQPSASRRRRRIDYITQRSTCASTSTSNNSLPRIIAMPLVISSILLPFFPIANIVKDCNWVFQRRERGLGSAHNLSASTSSHALVLLSTFRFLSIPPYYQSLLAKLNQNTEADPASELYSVLTPPPRKTLYDPFKFVISEMQRSKPHSCWPKSLSWLLSLWERASQALYIAIHDADVGSRVHLGSWRWRREWR